MHQIDIGERLRRHRQHKGLSQRALARLSGVTNGLISQIEQNRISPSIASLKKILDVLSLSLADFFTARLVVIDRDAIRPGASVTGREIATLAAPLLHDNYEALAVTREAGATIVWIASDDNREWFEQSLLLKFRLERF